jgi:hypothetical protein
VSAAALQAQSSLAAVDGRDQPAVLARQRHLVALTGAASLAPGADVPRAAMAAAAVAAGVRFATVKAAVKRAVSHRGGAVAFLRAQPSALSRPGRSISAETLQLVHACFIDWGTRASASKRHVWRQGEREHPVRFLTGSLEELYLAFKAKHPDAKIGLAKFTALRPPWVKPVRRGGG